MLKDEAKKQYQRDYMKEYQRKQRSKQSGLNIAPIIDGSNIKGLTKEEGGMVIPTVIGSFKRKGITYPDIIDKLTDPVWRKKLEALNNAFKASSNPGYAKDVLLGGIPMDVVFDYLECTR